MAEFVVESKGFRIGPDWYPEAVFPSREAAEEWLSSNRDRLSAEVDGREIRISED